MAEQYSVICVCYVLFICLSVDRHLSCLHMLSIMNSVLITTETHVGKKTLLKVICVGQDLMGLSMERIAGALKV